ncbi:MAG: hypothetical protein AAB394_03980 [Patescibacteria group bacterium]
MLPEFKKYLDNFYLSISGFWCLTLKDVKEKLLMGRGPGLLDTSIGEPSIQVNMYAISSTLPEAPFTNNKDINKIIEMQARLLIMGCYDWLNEEYQLNDKEFSSLPDIIQLFYSLRNASAHNNKFKFSPKVKQNFPLKWRMKNLTKEDEGKGLFSQWMSGGDIEYFLEDVSKTDLDILKV